MYPMMDRYEYQAIFKTRYTYLVNGTEVRKPYTLSENTTLIVPYKVRSGADTGGSIVIKLTSVLNPEVGIKIKDRLGQVKTLIHVVLYVMFAFFLILRNRFF